MDMGLKGRRAIVCASSKGLGRGCAEALAHEGCEVIINGRSQDTLEATATAIRAATGAKIIAVAADVGTKEGQQLLLEACPNPDILVNNNGGPPRKDYKELNRETMIDGVIQNMITPIELIQAVIDGMIERKFGRIVNITSLSVKMPIEGLDLSSGARAGLTGFMSGVCRTFTAHNVTMNNILPGKMDTDRLRGGIAGSAKAAGIDFEVAAQNARDGIPARRFGTAEEFGKTCCFLCSDHASYITGQNILLDGGLFNGAF
ncbi:MAG: SDR family oxidoreductase [Hyphomicrobiales bacterium]